MRSAPIFADQTSRSLLVLLIAMAATAPCGVRASEATPPPRCAAGPLQVPSPDWRDLGFVAEGDAVFSPRLAGFVLDAFGAAAGEIAEVDEELDRLSAREREVMRLIARGYQYKEVAKELFISIKTVETHVSSVLRKLQLSSRHELTTWAMGRKLI